MFFFSWWLYYFIFICNGYSDHIVEFILLSSGWVQKVESSFVCCIDLSEVKFWASVNDSDLVTIGTQTCSPNNKPWASWLVISKRSILVNTNFTEFLYLDSRLWVIFSSIFFGNFSIYNTGWCFDAFEFFPYSQWEMMMSF